MCIYIHVIYMDMYMYMCIHIYIYNIHMQIYTIDIDRYNLHRCYTFISVCTYCACRLYKQEQTYTRQSLVMLEHAALL